MEDRLQILETRLNELAKSYDDATLNDMLDNAGLNRGIFNTYTMPGNEVWPKPTTLVGFAMAFRVSCDYLLGLSDSSEAKTYAQICRVLMRMIDKNEIRHAPYAILREYSHGSREDRDDLCDISYLADDLLSDILLDYQALSEHIGDSRDLLHVWVDRQCRKNMFSVSKKVDEEELKQHFAIFLEQYRAEHEYKRRKFEDLLGKDQPSVAKYFNARVLPSIETMLYFHKKEGVSLDDMLFPDINNDFEGEFHALIELLHHGCLSQNDYIIYDSPNCYSESFVSAFVITDWVLAGFCREYFQMLDSIDLVSESGKSINRAKLIEEWFSMRRDSYNYPLLQKDKHSDFHTLTRFMRKKYDSKEQQEIYLDSLEYISKYPQKAERDIEKQLEEDYPELPFEV